MVASVDGVDGAGGAVKTYPCTAVGCDENSTRLVDSGPRTSQYPYCVNHAGALIGGEYQDAGHIGEGGCWCGCADPVTSSRAKYATSACSSRHWRERTGYVIQGTQTRRKAAQRRNRSGRQVSYAKAVKVLAREIANLRGWHPDGARARARAEDVLSAALPDRQRTDGGR